MRLEDILRETPMAQDFIAEGLEQGLEQGIKKGVEQGKAVRNTELLLKVVRERFPVLLPLVEQQRDALIHRADFDDFFFTLIGATDELQACQILLGTNKA